MLNKMRCKLNSYKYTAIFAIDGNLGEYITAIKISQRLWEGEMAAVTSGC